MSQHPTLLPLALFTLLITAGSAAQAIETGFSPQAMRSWSEKSFDGHTSYSIVQRDGVPVLEAHANGQASAKYLEREIDLERTPWLKWCWQVSGVHAQLDETTRQGDDYPARVYVAQRTGLLPWQVESVNYVWSSNQPVGTRWPNAFTDKAQLLAVESGGERVGQWVSVVRDVRADFRELFGSDPASIDGIALMTDGDNAGVDARAWFSRLVFSSDSQPLDCP